MCATQHLTTNALAGTLRRCLDNTKWSSSASGFLNRLTNWHWLQTVVRMFSPAIGAQLSFTVAAGGGIIRCLQVLLASCFGNWSCAALQGSRKKGELSFKDSRLGTSVVYKILNRNSSTRLRFCVWEWPPLDLLCVYNSYR